MLRLIKYVLLAAFAVTAFAGTVVQYYVHGKFVVSVDGDYNINGITNMTIPFIPCDATWTSVNDADATLKITWDEISDLENGNYAKAFGTMAWPAFANMLASQNTKNRGYYFVAPFSGNYSFTVDFKGDIGGVHNYLYLDSYNAHTQLFDGQFSSDTTMIINATLQAKQRYTLTVGLGSGSVLLHTAGDVTSVVYSDSTRPQVFSIFNKVVATNSVAIASITVGSQTTVTAVSGQNITIDPSIRRYSGVTVVSCKDANTSVIYDPITIHCPKPTPGSENMGRPYQVTEDRGSVVSGPVISSGKASAVFIRNAEYIDYDNCP